MSDLQINGRKSLFDDGILWQVGECVFVRTVTFHVVGRIMKVINDNGNTWLVLDNASWVADSGQWTQAIDDGVLSEVEPVKSPVRVNTSSATDVYCWFHPLPDKQK